MILDDEIKPYRIGYGPIIEVRARRAGAWGGGLRRTCDRWGRCWQAEAPSVCRFARRAWTAKGARRKMLRDVERELLGRRSLYQWWCWLRQGEQP